MHIQSQLYISGCVFVFTVVVQGRELRPGGGSGPGVGVRRGLVEASWIILQPEDPPSPSAVSWTMRIKLLLFLNSEKRQDDKDTVPPGSPWLWLWLGAELRGGGREGVRRRRREAGGGRGSIIKLIPSQFPLGAK